MHFALPHVLCEHDDTMHWREGASQGGSEKAPLPHSGLTQSTSLGPLARSLTRRLLRRIHGGPRVGVSWAAARHGSTALHCTARHGTARHSHQHTCPLQRSTPCQYCRVVFSQHDRGHGTDDLRSEARARVRVRAAHRLMEAC